MRKNVFFWNLICISFIFTVLSSVTWKENFLTFLFENFHDCLKAFRRQKNPSIWNWQLSKDDIKNLNKLFGHWAEQRKILNKKFRQITNIFKALKLRCCWNWYQSFMMCFIAGWNGVISTLQWTWKSEIENWLQAVQTQVFRV